MAAGGGGCSWRLVEWDAKAYLDLPAGDADVLYDKAHQPLAAGEVERVDPGGDGLGELADSLA